LIGYADNVSITRVYGQGIDNISGASSVGGLVGELHNGALESSSIWSYCDMNGCQQGEVSGTGDNIGGLVGKLVNSQLRYGSAGLSIVAEPASSSIAVGGLVGLAQSSVIESSQAHGTISAAQSDQVGGLAGTLDNSTVRQSSASGDFTGRDEIGGLIGGITSGSQSLVENSYTDYANLTATTKIGGLVGFVGDNSSIKHTYASAHISGTSDIGGLIGILTSPSTVINSYYDNQTYSQTSNGIGEPRTTKQLEETQVAGGTVDGQQTFVGWDFSTSWDPASSCRAPRANSMYGFYDECILIGGLHYPSSPVDPSAAIQVGFSRPLDNSSIDNTTVYFSPAVADISFQYDNVTRLLTITPAGSLSQNTAYTLHLSSNIQSEDGQPYFGNTFSFQTTSP